MAEKHGVTNSIRNKLGFTDERLWKQFLARRLELIDSFDLSSKKASEQEQEIKKTAEILRHEFRYDEQYCDDFDSLVRAAVQSVRRNRKRSTKTGFRNKKRRPIVIGSELLGLETPEHKPLHAQGGRFLLEISNLNADAHDFVYDMSYSTLRVMTNQDRSRAAIDSIIKPPLFEKKGILLNVTLPDILSVALGSQQAENEKELAVVRQSLLQMMKRSRLCLAVASLQKGTFFKTLGQSAIQSVSALMLDHSFLGLNQTSTEYLQERIGNIEFLANFYRSLEPDCQILSSLDNTTAVTTLETLIGCCIKDFGYNAVLYPVGEAFYRSILLEYPLVLLSSVPFRKLNAFESTPMEKPTLSDMPPRFPASLSNLAAIATELRSQGSEVEAYNGSTNSEKENDVPAEKKKVKLTFLSQSLNFFYPVKNSAPPRYNELLDNAKQAFKLNENQVYGLRNPSSGAQVNSDFDLEKIFDNDQDIELEIFFQRARTIPIYEITSAVTPSIKREERPTIILPPPVLPLARSQLPPFTRAPLLPKFQPLL